MKSSLRTEYPENRSLILLHLVLCRRPVVALRTGGVATPYPSTRVIHNLPAFNRPCPPALSLRTNSCSRDAEVGAGQASEVGTAAVQYCTSPGTTGWCVLLPECGHLPPPPSRVYVRVRVCAHGRARRLAASWCALGCLSVAARRASHLESELVGRDNKAIGRWEEGGKGRHGAQGREGSRR